VRYEQPRDGSLARERAAFASSAMIFTPQGLMLGAGAILVPAEGIRKLKSLERQKGEVLALLSAAYGKAVAPSVLGNIERAAKSWSEGDGFTAHIHLAHTGLHPLDDFSKAAHRLRVAKGALDHGASPRAVFEALHLDARYIDTLEKLYNPAQPRVPAGHPGGGEWTSGDWGGAANASSRQVLSDALPDNPWKPGAQSAALEAGIHADTSIVDVAPAHRIEFRAPNTGTEGGSENGTVIAGETITPCGFTIEPLQGQDPLDPQRLNGPIAPDEQQKIADALTLIINEDRAALNPQPYLNYPHPRTGAVLPPSVGGYTTHDVPGIGAGRGAGRLVVDNVSGAIYYTNTHYRSFYPVQLNTRGK
jgi:hypothetical protein